MALPLLEDVIYDLRWGISLVKLGIVEGLRQKIPETVESSQKLILSRVNYLQSTRNVTHFIAQRGLFKARFILNSLENGLYSH